MENEQLENWFCYWNVSVRLQCFAVVFLLCFQIFLFPASS